MLIGKDYLCTYLEEQAMKIVLDRDKIFELSTYCLEQYNIPRGVIADFITQRRSFNEASDFILFALLDGFTHILSGLRKKLNFFFTESEIKTYSKAQFEESRIEFPLEFSMVQIASDQWIGRISVDELMKLRKAQMINYNENAQRTMKKMIRGDKEYYKININKTAVKEIKNALEESTFISNTLTLNIPEDSEAEFGYDESTKTLTIQSLDAFDIIDGYHRFIALSQVKDSNIDFTYEMELRIVNFSDDKARMFIYQEDQKTKMSKIDVNTYNVLNAGNRVCERLNENPKCNVQGLIGVKGIISQSELAALIDYFYFKNNVSKTEERVTIIQVTKELIEDFNLLTEYDVKYLESSYDFRTILTVMYIFYKFSGKDKNDMCETIERTVAQLKINTAQDKKFYNRRPRKALINEVEKAMKGGN